jgi:hypothetical protein
VPHGQREGSLRQYSRIAMDVYSHRLLFISTYHRKTPLGNQEYGNSIILKWVLEKQYYGVKTKLPKLHGLSPQANSTDRATAACRRSDCQLVRIEGATWSA